MKVQFLGAAGTVTGSRSLLTHRETKVLIDCGLFQGFKNLRLKNWDAFPVSPTALDAVLLTHAHLDHSGYIPLLVKNGFRGPIFATQTTIDLCRILLPDSGHLQEEEARFANKHSFSRHKPALPLYTAADAKACLNRFVPVPWTEPRFISKNGLETIEFQFFPAGHLPGAASILLRTDSSSIAFSGDLGRKHDPIVQAPNFSEGADQLVVESTYGNRRHPKNNSEDELKDVILRTIQRDGILLIPSFAIGRAQLILYYIMQLKRKRVIPQELPVYLNSPMAAQANRAFAANPKDCALSESELSLIWQDVTIVESAEESKALNKKTEPSIIVAASGMATGGRVLHHLKSLAPFARNTILFVGFQAGGTRGDLILRGAEEIKIHGQYWPVQAEVVSLETLSAHADADEIVAWVSSMQKKPKQIYVTHGEPVAADTLRHRLEEDLHIPALVPDYAQEFDLSR